MLQLGAMKLLTWNVASLRTLPPKLTGQSLGAFFAAHDADIVCLQEHKLADASKLLPELACVEGYDSYFTYSGKGYAGVCTFARKGATRWWTDAPFSEPLGAASSARPSASAANGASGGDRRRAVELDVDEDPDVSRGRCVLTDHVDFLILNIYAPNAGRGESFLARKMEFYSTMSDCVRKWRAAGRRVIVTGDLNTAPSELDIYNPGKFAATTGFLPSERAYIEKFCKNHDAVDAFRHLHPDTRKYSFWDYRTQQRPLNNGWRIDLHLCSRELLYEACSAAGEDRGATDADTADAGARGGGDGGGDGDRSSSSRVGRQAGPRLVQGVKSDVLINVHGSDHCPISLELPHIQLRSNFPTCKGAANERKELQPRSRRIEQFFAPRNRTTNGSGNVDGSGIGKSSGNGTGKDGGNSAPAATAASPSTQANGDATMAGQKRSASPETHEADESKRAKVDDSAS